MHCSANVGDDGDVAIFFGLSGHGQDDALRRSRSAADRRRRARLGRRRRLQLRGRLLREGDPALRRGRAGDLRDDAHRSGRCSRTSSSTSSGVLDLDDDSKTENTRAAYKLEQISNALPTKRAGHPSTVVFLTADAFGILPPIARLTRDQALYYFLSGFTAKLAGTEIGVTEPQPTFSTCFGAPFLPQPPAVYARMLGEKLDEHGPTRLAREHGLDGRPVRRGRADADRGDARAAACRARRASSTASSTAPTTSSASRCRSRCRASTRSCSTRARPGATPRRTTAKAQRARADVPRQLRAVRATSTPRSPRPGRAADADASRRGVPVASASRGGEARRPRRRRRLRGHARGDRGIRRRRRRRACSRSSTRRAATPARPRAASTRRSATRPRTTPRSTPTTRSRAPTTSATRTRSRSSAREAPGDIYQLEHWGAVFSRTEDGRLAQRPFGAAGSPRTVVRRRHHRPRADPGALRAGRASATSTVYEEFFAWKLVDRRRPLPGRDLAGIC